MDLSLLNDEAMDDSFLVIRPEEMDDEVTQIFKKWKLNNPLPKKDNVNSNNNNETFDSRTFTRPPKRRTFNMPDSSSPSLQTNSDMQSMESGIASINLQVGGVFTPLSMQRSWLNDVSPPSSICTSMDFQNNDNMLNSLITSSDFSNVSFLLNGSVHENHMDQTRRLINAINNHETKIPTNTNPNNQNLMNFTFDLDKTITNKQLNTTFGMGNTFVAATTTDSEPIKEVGIENADIQLNVSTEDVGKNLTFNKYDCNNLTWDKIEDQHPDDTIVQSTPVHNPANDQTKILRNIQDFDDTISPISSLHAQNTADDEDDEILLRNIKGRKLVDEIAMDDYRNSIEDQCEFLLNEETIKLSTRVLGESFECLNDLRNALITSADANEKEFDEMLDTFNVKKSKESEKLLQSVDNIKQRHSLINMEKQREDKQKKDCENDNRTQYDVMNKSSERLLNRRSRLFDDVNLQLQQKQQNEASTNGGSVGMSNHNSQFGANDAENDEVIDKNDRDRFKTIKLNRPRLQTGMVIVNDTEESHEKQSPPQNEISPGTNKERRNQINQQKQQDGEDIDFKKPIAPASKLSKFGFSRPTYKSRNDLNLPLKANSTDSLDNDTESTSHSNMMKKGMLNLKSPMGIKSKSIHNLMFNGAQNGIRMTSNLKLNPETTKSQSNLKAPRASSLVRPSVESNFKIPQTFQPRAQNNRKTAGLVRPSSGYYGNSLTKRIDSDNDSYSLSSSSASSRNSVHLSLAPEQQLYHQNSLPSTEELNQPVKKFSGAVPKPSGIARPMSGLPRPQVKSGLPRPKR